MAGSAAWLVGLVIWNLLAAHFRDAKFLGVKFPEIAALGLFTKSPLGLASIYSYGLLVAGVSFATLAAVAAFKMDDPYPGYGAIYRRHEERCDEYNDEIEGAMADLKSTRDEGIDYSRSVREQLRAQFGERGRILANREINRKRFIDYQDHLETIANTLLNHYRSANARARVEKSPAHFGTEWSLQRTQLPVVADEPSIDAEVARAQESLERSIETISAAYTDSIDSFETLEHIKRSLGDG